MQIFAGVRKTLSSVQSFFNVTALRTMNSATNGPINDEVHMTVPELITHHGYKGETHHVWTKDGYRLEMYRVMPNKKKISKNLGQMTDAGNEKKECMKKPAVLIFHGLLTSSADWLLLGPEKALAYLLCDEGYDVWLANVRGTRYSQYHNKYTTKDKEFWNFSWHEIGLNDIPASIDYVLHDTGNSYLYYIGYSQGTTAFFVMASILPEYNRKIRGMVCMAPIAFLSNQRSPLLKCVVPLHMVLKWASEYCNINKYLPRSKFQVTALTTLLRRTPDTITKTFGNCWFHLVAGFGSDQLDESMLPLIFSHFPAGSSMKQIIHYCQLIQTGAFRQFDYGRETNLKTYNTEEPPDYDLTKVKLPVAIFHSKNDFLNHPADVERIFNALPNVVDKIEIKYSKFNHIDYLWGKDAKTLVYNDIIKVLRRF